MKFGLVLTGGGAKGVLAVDTKVQISNAIDRGASAGRKR
jgi:hypothetical protein